jgi:hypothetical protein
LEQSSTTPVESIESSLPKAANNAFELFQQINEKNEPKAISKPKNIYHKSKRLDINVEMNGSIYDSYLCSGRALFRSINQEKDQQQFNRNSAQDENDDVFVDEIKKNIDEDKEDELMDQDAISEHEESFKFQSPSYSPLESPIRENVPFLPTGTSQSTQMPDISNNSNFSTVNYLDVFNECIHTIDTILIVVECMEDLLERVEVEVSKQPHIEAIKISKYRKPKRKLNEFTEPIELNDDMKLYFDLNSIQLKNPTFADTNVSRKPSPPIRYQTNNIMDQIMAFFRNLILSYVCKEGTDFSTNEVDIDLAKLKLNAYLKELKTNKRENSVGEDPKLVGLIMINSCFMAVDIVSNYGFKSFAVFFKNLIEKHKTLIESTRFKTFINELRC